MILWLNWVYDFATELSPRLRLFTFYFASICYQSAGYPLQLLISVIIKNSHFIEYTLCYTDYL